MKALIGMILAATLLGNAAYAEQPLVSRLQALVVTKADDGTEQFKRADLASPGTVIEYRLSYENVGDDTLNGLVVSGPVPKGARYISGSSTTSTVHDFQVSVDGGATWHSEPLLRTIEGDDGRERTDVVPASEYTGVRWVTQQPLLAQSSQEYRYRVRVESADRS